jgi:hypothetical protein
MFEQVLHVGKTVVVCANRTRRRISAKYDLVASAILKPSKEDTFEVTVLCFVQ